MILGVYKPSKQTVPVVRRRLERRLAAVMGADIMGYSALMGRAEAETHLRVGTELDRMIREIEKSRGRVFSFGGDSLMAEFPSAIEALKCALRIQSYRARRNARLPPEQQILFRIGINSGEIVLQEDRAGGNAVNIAARLEAIAQPGGIALSDNVFHQVRREVPAGYACLGEQRLKNIREPVTVHMITAAECSGWSAAPASPRRSSRAAPADVATADLPRLATDPAATATVDPQSAEPPLALPDKPSIAVLAFHNASSDAAQSYFSDGIAEDITVALSRNPGLFVIAQQSSFSYKGSDISVRVMARELGVRYILRGSVRRAVDRVRISAQLVDAEIGANLWAEQYDRDLSNIFALQDEITAAVVASIEPSIAAREHQHSVHKPTESLGAWETYHRGLWHYSKSTATENETARQLFRRAIELDPSFSSAFQGLALTYLDEAVIYAKRSAADAAAEAEAPARKAVALAPNDANAHVVLTYLFFVRGDLETAVAGADYALGLNANCAGAYWAKSGCLAHLARFREAIEPARTFLRLSPRDPRNWRVLYHLTLAAYAEGDYQEAADVAKRGIRANPDQPAIYRLLIAALGQLGRVEEAQMVIRDVSVLLGAVSFDTYAAARGPWLRDIEYTALLDGLRKAGWRRPDTE